MADATYQPKVYRDDGGDRLTIISGGALILESGSTFTPFPVTSVSTDAAAITNAGITVLAATAGTSVDYALAQPRQGCVKFLVNTKDGGSTSQDVSSTGAGATFGTTGLNTITFKNAEQGALLVGGSTSLWYVVATYGSPTLS
jgi:hypothetical protein